MILTGAILLALATAGHAATSTRSVPSTFNGNGHNESFDGRLFLTRDATGWVAYVLRPEAVTYAGGLPNATGPMWSAKTSLIAGPDIHENALAICEPDHAKAGYACDASGAASAAGPFDCYDVQVIDSDAVVAPASGGTMFRRRHLLLWVAEPRTATAHVDHFTFGAIEPLIATDSSSLVGIEATVTADGKLMMWNGTTGPDRKNESLAYAFNPTPCAATGWSPARPISHMVHDSAVAGYRLAQRTLRSADGTVLTDGVGLPGAYPWLLPDGSAVMFQAANMPCRATDVPAGCGPRRNQTSVVGYPTNWGVAIVDGGINPDTDQTVRLFFSSPGRTNFPTSTTGADVWPFFGSNTANYVEVSFDDGQDGRYAGLWHLNESVTPDGFLDRARTPDVSGYFNTARIVPPDVARDLLGGGQTFDGTQAARAIADDASLDPTTALAVELTLTPTAPVDCDTNNNYRLLLFKGGTNAYSLVFEEGQFLQARVQVVGGATYAVFSNRAIPIGKPTPVAFTYDAATGVLAMYVDGVEVNRSTNPPAALAPDTGPLYVGGLPTASPACPVAGTFAGTIAALDVSTRAYTSGVTFPAANNGVVGKAAVFDGTGRLVVKHDVSLNPTNAITLEVAVSPDGSPDCDATNNWRWLLRKGDAYSLVLEENGEITARVRTTGGAIVALRTTGHAIPFGAFTNVAATYDGATGVLKIYFDTVEVATHTEAPAALEGTLDDLTIGGPLVRPAACSDGDGGFRGTLDEVKISNIVRALVPPPAMPDAGTGPGGADAGTSPTGSSGGGCCRADAGELGAGRLALVALVAFVIATGRRAGSGRRRRRS